MITQYRPSYYQAPRAPSFAGRSIDEKPLDVENGSTFKEIDTGRVFRYDKENNVWIEQKGATPVQPAKPEQAKTVDLNMATGNQTVTPDSGKVLTSVTVTKPDTLVAENIKSGVDIGGVAGTLAPAKAEQIKTVDLAMAAGNQTISPDSGKVLSSAVVTKPTTLIAGNIKKGVNIGGVIGTLEEGTSAKEPYIEETYDANGNLTGAVMHGYTRIRDDAFSGCAFITSISLPEGVTNIGRGAFTNSGLVQLTFPDSIAIIEEYAFDRCEALALTSLPDSITSIGGYAFNSCTNLALTSLPSGLTSIGEHAFQYCTALALTSLPSGLTNIGECAFANCTNLALTSLPSGLTSIGKYAFENCTNLDLTSLPDGWTSIGEYVFYTCPSLALTSLPSGLTSIGESAFYECTNLALTSLPSGITSIGLGAFYGCTNLALTSLPSGLMSVVDSSFSMCTNLALTSLPDGITSIERNAFYKCTNLALTSLPSGITSIGLRAFAGCIGLTSITFEGTPTSINSRAFEGCIKLTEIKVPWAEGAVANAPWGATNATVTYNYTA